MSDVIAVLDQLNRDIAELQHKHRRVGEESYPGAPGELRLSRDEYDALMLISDYQSALAEGIDIARQVVLKTRAQLEQQADSPPATPNQKRYVYSLSIDLGIRGEIDDQCRERYGVPVDGLTKAQAGETIERLKGELDALTMAGFRKGAAID